MRAFVITGPGKADVRDVAPREPRPAGFVHASNATFMPALAADLVEPGRRLVYIGLAGEPSLVDTQTLVLKDVTAVGVRSASGGIAGTVELYASGAVGLDDLATVLVGERRAGWGTHRKSTWTPSLTDP